jgi:hypothetical protein
MSLQLEVGKTYKDREGRLITITDKKDFNCTYPYTGDSGKTYMPNGRFHDYGFHDNDLVEEVRVGWVVSGSWAFPNFKQEETTEETKMQDQIVTINCTLVVVRDIEGTLTLQVHPKEEFWRADASTTILDSSFELVLPKAKVQELYLEALNSNLDKVEAAYNDALEARDSGLAFIRSL